MKPVTLVRTVVARNKAVQPDENVPRNMPIRTTRPAAMPIRLMIVCTVVNVEIDMPKIMMLPFGAYEREAAVKMFRKLLPKYVDIQSVP
jgi:hypothetical protein